MRLVFEKYLVLFLTGIIVQAIVVITVLVQTFGYTNGLAHWLFNIINGWTVSLYTFRFIADWAEALSALAVCLVLAALFADFREYRRYRALGRLHDWTKNTVLTLADYHHRAPALPDPPRERYDGIKALIDKLKANCHAALADAQISGGELNANTKKAVNMLSTIDEKIEKQDESAVEDLRTLQHNLADIMIYAFESLQQQRDKGLLFQRRRSRNQEGHIKQSRD